MRTRSLGRRDPDHAARLSAGAGGAGRGVRTILRAIPDHGPRAPQRGGEAALAGAVPRQLHDGAGTARAGLRGPEVPGRMAGSSRRVSAGDGASGRDAGPVECRSLSGAGGERAPAGAVPFSSFRIFHPRWIQLCCGYNPPAAAPFYARYLETLDRIDRRLAERGIGRSCVPFSGDRWWLLRLGWRLATGRATVRHWRGRRIIRAAAAQEFPPWESSPDPASNCPP